MIRRRTAGRRAWDAILAAFLSASLAACASYRHLYFAPAVQDTDLRGDDDDLEAHVAVTWNGVVEREDVPELRFTLTVDNPGATPFALVPAEFELLDANLASFGILHPESPVVVEVGATATFELAFPAAGVEKLAAFDLGALTLRARLQGGRWEWSTPFERVYPSAYDGSFDFGVSFSGGSGHCSSPSPGGGGGFAQRGRL